MTNSPELIAEARRLLTAAVQQLATDTVRTTGIDYRAISPEYWHGPDTWEALQSVYTEARLTALAGQWAGLPVFGGASDQTIYLTAEANHAFRYWHDMGHIRHNLSFTGDDERALQTRYHLDVMWHALGAPLADEGREAAALLAFSMYYADTVGQIEYVETHKRFPENQLAFALDYVTSPALALANHY